MASASEMVGSAPAADWNSEKSPVPMPTMTASTSTLMPEATTLPSTFSARNEVRFQSAKGTSTKPASVVSLNSSTETKSCTARMKKATMTMIQATNRTTMVSMFVKTDGKPASLPISSSIGCAACTPTVASRPGWRSCASPIDAPDAFRPRPAKERKTMEASQLKLPMMKAKAPT